MCHRLSPPGQCHTKGKQIRYLNVIYGNSRMIGSAITELLNPFCERTNPHPTIHLHLAVTYCLSKQSRTTLEVCVCWRRLWDSLCTALQNVREGGSKAGRGPATDVAAFAGESGQSTGCTCP